MLPVPRKPNQPPISPEPQPTAHHHESKPNLDPTPAPALKIKWLWVLRDVVILFAATFAGGQLIGFASYTLNDPHVMERLPTVNILFMTFGFFLIAYLVRENRVRHFLAVFISLWVVGTLPNVIFFNANLATLLINWLASAPLIAFAMMVGGAAGSAIFKPKNKPNVA